jgi:adenylyltransferase/sulfurtransferase
MNQVTPAELASQLKRAGPPALLDVREPEEHSLCSLPGSRLIPLGELFDRLGELDDWKHRDVVVYCHHGIRSAHAIAILQSAGFARLANLSGGIDGWSLDVDPSVPRY